MASDGCVGKTVLLFCFQRCYYNNCLIQFLKEGKPPMIALLRLFLRRVQEQNPQCVTVVFFFLIYFLLPKSKQEKWTRELEAASITYSCS